MSSNSLRVALVQMTSTDSIQDNEARLLGALEQIQVNTDVVCFPENCWFTRLSSNPTMPSFKERTEFHVKLQGHANRLNAALVLGTVPMPVAGDARPRATTVVFLPIQSAPDQTQCAREAVSQAEGLVKTLYQKLHLFDVDVEGSRPVRESDVLSAGEAPAVWNFRGFRIGCAICYDVRFANLFYAYAELECDAIMLPSAFLVPTGRSHWDTLVRARAIESQCYILAAAQSGEHVSVERSGESAAPLVRKTYGKSMVVDPWGRPVAVGSTEKSGLEILYWTLEKREIQRVREQIPMHNHRRAWTEIRVID